MKKALWLLLFCVFLACNEKYNFNVQNKKRGIVVEALLSNKSFTDALQIPSDGRYFSVTLGETSDVDNIRNPKISGALITLSDSEGRSWNYTEEPLTPGLYFLKEEFFKALPNVRYQLKITLSTGEIFESEWEELPKSENTMGEIHIAEHIRQQYGYNNYGQKEITAAEGINVSIDIPASKEPQERFFVWTFEPFFTFTAALADVRSPYKKCWVTSPYYLQYTEILADDKQGGYPQELFFMETKSNERVYDYFSAAIHQFGVSEEYYTFWKDLNGQRDKGGLFDQPPYSLFSNFTAVNNNWTTNGYFAVASEEFTRWELNKKQLSYPIIDDLEYFCELYRTGTDPSGEDACIDCRFYPRGEAVNYPPAWWVSKYRPR